MKIRAIFFDLDDTLFDCLGLLVENAHRGAVKAMIVCGLDADEEEAYVRRIAIHEAAPGTDLDRALAESYGAGDDEKIVSAGRNAFYRREIGSIETFPGVCEMLDRLRENRLLFLVTMGDVNTQAQKVARLGLGTSFHEIAYITPPGLSPEKTEDLATQGAFRDLEINTDATKKKAFRHLLNKYRLYPPHCLSVGNRVDSEIRDAVEVGMRTVLVAGGEFAGMKPSSAADEPDFYVENVGELEDVLLKIENPRS